LIEREPIGVKRYERIAPGNSVRIYSSGHLAIISVSARLTGRRSIGGTPPYQSLVTRPGRHSENEIRPAVGIAVRIAEQHNERVWLKSNAGNGVIA
jgi:hypothetical protein